MSWKEDFYKCIGSNDHHEVNTTRAHSLRMENLPDFLYKYRPVNEFSLNNLENDTVWLNKPSEYNDPFEFVEYLDVTTINFALNRALKDELISELTQHFPVPDEIIQRADNSPEPLKIISEYQLQHYDKLDRETISGISKITDDFLHKVITDAHLQKISGIKDKMKVCSFCESPNELLMWSHYADQHKGFCIEYDIKRWAPNDIRFRLLYPVIYSDTIYDSSAHLVSQIETGTFNNFYALLSGNTKSLDWEYEKEWRFIFQIGESFLKQNYPMSCQTKVFLGSRMQRDDRERVLNVCRKKGIRVFNAEPSKNKYQLEFLEL